MGRYYHVGELATLTRVSVRTLHHYDRIGLLRPALHSAGGYRMYGELELLRLQQILTLRYLGFPLKRIGELLDRDDFNLVASLRVQRHATGEWSWQLVIDASRAVGAGLTQGEETMEAYYTPEQMAQFAEARRATPQDEIEAIEQGWTALLAEVRANYDLDPASAKAHALSARADELTARTMRGFEQYPELAAAIGANYQRGAFAGNPQAPQAADFAFFERVKAARTDAAGNTESA